MRHFSKAIILISVMLALIGGMAVHAQADNAQRNKELVRSAMAQLSTGDPSAYYALFPDEFMMNQGDTNLAPMAKADVEAYADALMAALPDLQMVPDVIIAQGDWVAVPVTLTGTFTQPYSFAPITTEPVAPNNQSIRWTEMNFIHFDADGLISETWGVSDPTVLFGQMGIFPMEGGDTPAEGASMTEPVGVAALTADELAATFTSGMEARNTATLEALVAQPLGTDSSAYYASPTISHNSGTVSEMTSAGSEDPFASMLTVALPDLASTPAVVVAEGDWAAVLLNLSGTFTGEASLGDMTLTPTGQPIQWQFAVVERFNSDGKIVEEWLEINAIPLLAGLGLMPGM